MPRTPATEDIALSVARSLGDAELVAKLASLKPSELTSLLLAVHRVHAARRSWADVRAAHEHALFAPSSAPVSLVRECEDAFFDAAGAAGFDVVELGPVEPLGLAQRTGIDANNALACVRNAEVLADPTAGAALEVATRRRRRQARAAPTKLASSSRLLRMQPLPKNLPGASRHFRVLSLVTGVSGDAAARASLEEHVRIWLALLEELAARGYATSRVAVALSPAGPAPSSSASLAWGRAEALAALKGAFPRVDARFDAGREQGRGYYRDWMMKLIVGGGADGIAIADGGVVDWTARILGDNRERLVTSALGVEILAKRLGPSTSPAARVDERTTLRRATLEDGARLLAILRSPSVSARWPDYDEERVRDWLTRAGGESDVDDVFCIVRDGAVVGAIQVNFSDDPEYPYAGMDLFVSDEVRGAGAADAAIRLACAHAFARGTRRIVIDPARDNYAARRVYSRVGFRTVGVLRRYERDHGGPGAGCHDGVLMELIRE